MEKPKVRFSYNSEKATEPLTSKKVNHIQEKAKVKVKSIVPINLPIKVLKNGKRLLIKDVENTNDLSTIAEKNINRKSNSQNMKYHMPSNDEHKEMDSKQFETSKSELETETLISETPANYVHLFHDELNQKNKNDLELQNCTDQLQGVTIAETDKQFPKAPSMKINQIHKKIYNPNCISPIEKNIPCIHLDSSDSDEDIKEVEVVKNSNVHKLQQGIKNKIKLDNQEFDMAHAPQLENKENNSGHNDILKSFRKVKITKTSGILKDSTFASFNKNKNINTKKPVRVQRKLQVMPCAKFKSIPSVYNKHVNKQAASQTKTRSLFNIAGRVNNIVVQPEMADLLPNDHSKCHLTKSYKNKDIVSKNLLSQPEYNSAVCVMKKLKEFGEERLINDVESLPATYRNMVQGKVSSALDFSPYESIYKNLINLSVDDDKFPTRLTRTKDPEPRDKDVTPSLSKFYTPKSTKEHFISLDPKIFNPISVNNLNAFKISNKICTWRISRDSF